MLKASRFNTGVLEAIERITEPLMEFLRQQERGPLAEFLRQQERGPLAEFLRQQQQWTRTTEPLAESRWQQEESTSAALSDIRWQQQSPSVYSDAPLEEDMLALQKRVSELEEHVSELEEQLQKATAQPTIDAFPPRKRTNEPS